MSEESRSEGPRTSKAGDSSALPFLPTRLGMVFVSPGRLFRHLRDEPRWVGALVLGAVFVVLATAPIPTEIWVEMTRRQMLQRGGEIPDQLEVGGVLLRVVTSVGGMVFWFVWAFVTAGVTTFVFAFVLADDGRFRHYLSVTVHALLVVAVGALVTLPLKVARRDPQATLNLGVFFPFLDEGYLLTLLTMLDLFSLWSVVILALGVHEVDRRRSWGTACAILMGLAVGVTAVLAAVVPR